MHNEFWAFTAVHEKTSSTISLQVYSENQADHNFDDFASFNVTMHFTANVSSLNDGKELPVK